MRLDSAFEVLAPFTFLDRPLVTFKRQRLISAVPLPLYFPRGYAQQTRIDCFLHHARRLPGRRWPSPSTFTWIIINWRSVILLVIGVPFFLLLIAGLVLNTIFLVREVQRNERHDSFLNAVTHELKTPITSIRLYLETLQRHEVPEAQRSEFYDIMLSDTERLLATVEQVLKAGEIGQRARNQVRLPAAVRRSPAAECIRTTLQRYHLQDPPSSSPSTRRRTTAVVGNPGDLRDRRAEHPRQCGQVFSTGPATRSAPGARRRRAG